MEWEELKNQLINSKHHYFHTENGVLLCGDCLKIMKEFPKEIFDVIITDPPYGVNSNEQNGIAYRDNFYDVKKVGNLFFSLLIPNARCFVFSAQKTLLQVIEGFKFAGFKQHQILIWYRPNLAGGTKKKTYDFTSVYEMILNFHKGSPEKLKKCDTLKNFDVLTYPQPQSNFKDKRLHIHQKPIALIKHLIVVSTNKEDLILDPFIGSGTLAVACEDLNRKWVGIEINEEYCRIAKKRIEEERRKVKLFK